jgi:hypothetical protein
VALMAVSFLFINSMLSKRFYKKMLKFDNAASSGGQGKLHISCINHINISCSSLCLRLRQDCRVQRFVYLNLVEGHCCIFTRSLLSFDLRRELHGIKHFYVQFLMFIKIKMLYFLLNIFLFLLTNYSQGCN